MPHQVACPVCHHTLRIADDATTVWLTCPRCLTQVMNPRQGITTPAAIPPPAPMERPAEPASAEPRCSECGAPVEPSWRYCPHCDAPLGRVRDIQRSVAADQDVRRDTGLAGGGLVLLGLLGGLGIILFLCGGGLNQVTSKSSVEGIASAATIIGFVLFGAVVAGMVLGATGKTSGTRVATTILGAIAIVVLVLAVAIAFVVYTFASCLEPCGHRPARAASPCKPRLPCVQNRFFATREHLPSAYSGQGGPFDVARGRLSTMPSRPVASG
jgi:Double zinc ribbon